MLSFFLIPMLGTTLSAFLVREIRDFLDSGSYNFHLPFSLYYNFRLLPKMSNSEWLWVLGSISFVKLLGCLFLYWCCFELQIFERKPTKIKNYGIWLRYQSRTGYHNMYKEYRDTTLNGAVEQMYNEMASRHRVRFPCIQIIKTATIPAKLCKRENTKQFHDSKIKFPLVFKKVRPPTRKLQTTYKASRPNLFL